MNMFLNMNFSLKYVRILVNFILLIEGRSSYDIYFSKKHTVVWSFSTNRCLKDF